MKDCKIYWSIGEVSTLFALEQHVLRFWETEFSELLPERTLAGNRRYRQRDLDIVEKIKFLLYEELYTIDGARRKLKRLRSIPLVDYKKTETMLNDPVFVSELQKVLDLLAS